MTEPEGPKGRTALANLLLRCTTRPHSYSIINYITVRNTLILYNIAICVDV